MKKLIQKTDGFIEVESSISPEYFSTEELGEAEFQDDIKNAYTNAISDLILIQNTASPTQSQIIWAIKREAEIIEKMLKFEKNDLIE